VRRYPANDLLKWERVERGWSWDEVAHQLNESFRTVDGEDRELEGNTVRRWETGERWPEPRFRKHLVLVFGKTASELGLLTPDELAARPPPGESQLVEGSRSMSRQTFLRGALGVGLSAAILPLFGSEDALGTVTEVIRRAKRPGRLEVESYAEIAERQRQLYWTAEAPLLFEAVLAHTQMGLQLARDATPSVRRQFMPALAHSALLAGRIAFFDLRHTAVAERCLQVARAAVNDSKDHQLAVSVLAHSSFIPGFAGQRTAADRLLAGARGHLRATGGARLRAWVYCVESEIATRCGNPVLGVARAMQAEETLGTRGDDPPWLDFFDPARLASFRGYAEMLSRQTGAIDTLNSALANLGPEATKQRAVVLMDLAAAHGQHDAEHAVELAVQALDILDSDYYATGYERLPLVLDRLPEIPYRGQVQERLRTAVALT
jgi:transcriptional regulator with XRE-family HTH domain